MYRLVHTCTYNIEEFVNDPRHMSRIPRHVHRKHGKGTCQRPSTYFGLQACPGLPKWQTACYSQQLVEGNQDKRGVPAPPLSETRHLPLQTCRWISWSARSSWPMQAQASEGGKWVICCIPHPGPYTAQPVVIQLGT